MTYTKPKIVLLGDAARLTKGQVKNATVEVDHGGPIGTTIWNTLPAYESDE